MNDEYIRRVEAEEAIEEYCCRRCKDYSEVEGGCISHAQHCEHLSGEEILKPVKSADVQPVKHGKWEKDEKRNSFEKFCSVCKHEAYWDTDYGQQLFDYCPYCGARMDGDTNE